MAAVRKPVRTRRYRGVSAEKRRAERRDKLLAAGKQVFGTVGFNAATVRDICREAGLTERYFYESFQKLDALFGAVYDAELEQLRQRLMAALVAAERDPESLARAALTEFYGGFQRDPVLARLLLVEVFAGSTDLERTYQRGVADFAEIVRGIIESTVETAPESGLDPGLMATALVGTAIHLGLRWLLEDFSHPLETMVENHLAIILAVTETMRANTG